MGDKFREKKSIMSFTLQWHITSLCPNRCKHCYIDDRYDDSVLYEDFCRAWENISKFEDEHNVFLERISITGGDPLLNPDAWKIIEFLKGRKISILGIPERVTLDNIAKMKKMGVCSYQVSLDGLQTIHDDIRGRGSFEKTIVALKMLEEADIEHSVMFTANSMNYQELIPLIKYLDNKKIKTLFAFDFMVGEINDIDGELSMVDAETGQQLLKDYYKMLVELRESNSTVTLLEKNNMIKVLKSIEDKGDESNLLFDFCGGCSNGIFSLTVLPNGDVYPCRRLPIKIGNIFEQTMDEIFLENDLMKKFRNSSNYEYCKDCSYFGICRGCPAITYHFTKDPFEKYPYCFLKKEVQNTVEINCDSLELIMKCEPNVQANMNLKDYVINNLRYFKRPGNKLY